jgi:hypothetical protein
MKQKKRAGSAAPSSEAFPRSGTLGCGRRLSSLPQDGISRSFAAAEKDPTVHPETPRSNPDPG